MNTTLVLLLTHVLQAINNAEWTADVITRMSQRYFRGVDGGDLLVYHYFTEEPEDDLMERVLRRLYHRRDALVTFNNGTLEDEGPDFVKPRGILLFMEFSRMTFSIIVTDFVMKILKNLHVSLRVVVIVQHHKFVRTQSLLYLLEKFWNINVRNVIIVNALLSDVAPPALKICYWRPEFDFKKNAGIKAENVHVLTVSSTDPFFDTEDLFAPIDVTDVRGHFFNVSVAVTPPYVWVDDTNSTAIFEKRHVPLDSNSLDGIEVAILDEFRRKYNLTGYYIVHPSEIIQIGELKDDDVSDSYGVLEETALGMSDVAIGGNLANAELYWFFDPSSVYFEDNMYWYVPGPKEIPRWQNLYLIFDEWIWIAIAIIYVLLTLITFCVACSPLYNYDFSTTMLTILCTHIAQTVPPSALDHARILFVPALLYGMHISNFYQSGLIIVIHDKYYETPISTIEEAYDDGMTLCLSGISYDFFRSQNLSSRLGYFESNVYLDYSHCLDKVAYDRDAIALLPEKTTEYTIPQRYVDENFIETIAKMPKRLIRYPVSMYLTKASPYRDRLNFVIDSLVEGGLIRKWWSDIRFAKSGGIIVEAGDVHELHNHEYTPISLSNATGVFWVFALLLGISFGVFIVEVGWFYGKRKWASRKRRCANGAKQY